MPQCVTTAANEGGPAFTELEQKLIRLGLNEAAEPGEIANASLKLIESLRRRGMRPEVLILGSQLQPPLQPGTALAIARRRVMPFGRHRGRRLDAIEPDYLKWALRECSCLSLGLREAIKIVLQGGAN
jgi:uncharacterized protein (DUF3820 family)